MNPVSTHLFHNQVLRTTPRSRLDHKHLTMTRTRPLVGLLVVSGIVSSRSLFALLMLCSARSIAFQLSPTATRGLPACLSRSQSPVRSLSKRFMSSSSPSSALQVPTIPLRNGMEHPAICFGTYKVGFVPASASSAAAGSAETVQRTAAECVADALAVGYRALECAEFYGNQAQVGQAIAASGIPRSELFLCSKVWTTTIEKGPDAVRAQLDQTLADLQTDYLDLYLIHWPVPGHHVTAYKTLQELQKEGKIKGIGVSNYAWEDYVELKQDEGVTQLPLVNQIEINPFLYRKNTIRKFAAEGVVMQSYRSLRDGKAMDHPVLVAMASKYEKTVAQILGKWCLQKGFVYMPKSVQRPRMVENAQVLDFTLTDADVAALDGLTTPENIAAFVGLYRRCVNRDTSKDGSMEGVKMEITED